MGSGKGYLTFAVYDFFNRHAGIEAEVVGVESRAELVELCNRIAGAAGFDRLHFHTGYIRDFPAGEVDILIALTPSTRRPTRRSTRASGPGPPSSSAA